MEDQESVDMTSLTSNGTSLPLLTSLCALDRVFDATGIAEVKVGEKVLRLPIQAVDLEYVEALCKPFRPKVPTKRDMINGQWRTIIDDANEAYRDKLTTYNMLYAHATCCYGLAVDIMTARRDVVWSADNSVHDVEQAVKALKDMGLVLNQVISINRAINDLTALVQDQQLQD
mgnify:CR=1 FL=1